jgi:hypothetical protein
VPDAGENEAEDGKSGAIKRTSDGFDYLDPEQFREYFAADRSEKEAAFAAHSQLRIP